MTPPPRRRLHFFHTGRVDLPRAGTGPTHRLTRAVTATVTVKSLDRRRTLRELGLRPPVGVIRRIDSWTTAPDRLSAVGSHFTVRRPLSVPGSPVRRVVPLMRCPEGFPCAP